jgi:hypothetical protein
MKRILNKSLLALVAALAALSILAALIVLVAYATQAANIQIIVLQPVYWVLDAEWGAVRTLLLLLAAGSATAVLILRSRVRAGADSTPIFVAGRAALKMAGAIAGGLILGMLVFYTHTCCDNPAVYYLGFPLSWLRGVAPDWHVLPLPVVPYLFQNLARIGWFVDGFSLLVDILFWVNVAFLISAIQRRIWIPQALKIAGS